MDTRDKGQDILVSLGKSVLSFINDSYTTSFVDLAGDVVENAKLYIDGIYGVVSKFLSDDPNSVFREFLQENVISQVTLKDVGKKYAPFWVFVLGRRLRDNIRNATLKKEWFKSFVENNLGKFRISHKLEKHFINKINNLDGEDLIEEVLNKISELTTLNFLGFENIFRSFVIINDSRNDTRSFKTSHGDEFDDAFYFVLDELFKAGAVLEFLYNKYKDYISRAGKLGVDEVGRLAKDDHFLLYFMFYKNYIKLDLIRIFIDWEDRLRRYGYSTDWKLEGIRFWFDNETHRVRLFSKISRLVKEQKNNSGFPLKTAYYDSKVEDRVFVVKDVFSFVYHVLVIFFNFLFHGHRQSLKLLYLVLCFVEAVLVLTVILEAGLYNVVRGLYRGEEKLGSNFVFLTINNLRYAELEFMKGAVSETGEVFEEYKRVFDLKNTGGFETTDFFEGLLDRMSMLFTSYLRMLEETQGSVFVRRELVEVLRMILVSSQIVYNKILEYLEFDFMKAFRTQKWGVADRIERFIDDPLPLVVASASSRDDIEFFKCFVVAGGMGRAQVFMERATDWYDGGSAKEVAFDVAKGFWKLLGLVGKGRFSFI